MVVTKKWLDNAFRVALRPFCSMCNSSYYFLAAISRRKPLRITELLPQTSNAFLRAFVCKQQSRNRDDLRSPQCRCTEQCSLCMYVRMVLMPATLIDISAFKINSAKSHTSEATEQEANRLEAWTCLQ